MRIGRIFNIIPSSRRPPPNERADDDELHVLTEEDWVVYRDVFGDKYYYQLVLEEIGRQGITPISNLDVIRELVPNPF